MVQRLFVALRLALFIFKVLGNVRKSIIPQSLNLLHLFLLVEELLYAVKMHSVISGVNRMVSLWSIRGQPIQLVNITDVRHDAIQSQGRLNRHVNFPLEHKLVFVQALYFK